MAIKTTFAGVHLSGDDAAAFRRQTGVEDDAKGDTCATCKWAMPLSPGHAVICGEKWQRCEWNDAVPLTTKDEWCEKHETN